MNYYVVYVILAVTIFPAWLFYQIRKQDKEKNNDSDYYDLPDNEEYYD